MDVAIWGAISALFGGVLLKVAEGYFSGRMQKHDELQKWRGELILELKDKEEEIRSLRSEGDELQRQYFELRLEHNALQSKYERAMVVIEQLQGGRDATY